MPLRLGSLRSLARATVRPCNDKELSLRVLEQMLSALDYLACRDMCHRDIKPENILYWNSSDSLTFQLADFGFVSHRLKAVTKCGTCYYEAPELHPEYGNFAQSPKMDIWSLFATIADINPLFTFPPTHARVYADVLPAVRAAALVEPSLAPMVRENPNHRASAAQLLVNFFDGRGLSTPRARIPPMDATPPAPVASASVPAPNMPAEARAQKAVRFPLVKYPREGRRAGRGLLQPVAGGITKPSTRLAQAYAPAPAQRRAYQGPQQQNGGPSARHRLFNMPGSSRD